MWPRYLRIEPAGEDVDQVGLVELEVGEPILGKPSLVCGYWDPMGATRSLRQLRMCQCTWSPSTRG